MDIYLVGGAVRDELLGKTVKERDWVVVGGTVETMLADGYRQVGRDFPVFLHPDTSDEYALARTERKTGPGHTGFAVHADPRVTLEEDLERRDLTINAMARAGDGSLVDPYGGRRDLASRTLRHVSDAFEEDPLRVFRVARFAAQLPDFQIAEDTKALIRRMAARGALVELSAERVWAELEKALGAPAPARFIGALRECRALHPWFEEFESVEPVALAALDTSAQRFAGFVSGLSDAALERFAERLKVPRQHLRLARWVIHHAPIVAAWRDAQVDALHEALAACRAFKPDSGLASCLAVVEQLHAVDLAPLEAVVGRIVASIRPEGLQARGIQGAALGRALDGARIEALEIAQR